MPKTSDITLDDHQFGILLYGPSGAGKTWFLGTMPKPIFIFDWDGGVITLRGQEDIDYIEINPHDWADYEKFWKTFIVNKRSASWKGEDFQIDRYATIVIDSVTTKVNVVMNIIAENLQMKDRPRVGTIKGSHRADYNFSQNIIGATARELLATGKHIVFTAHERHERDEATGTIFRIGPSLAPGAFQTLAVLMDEVWRLDSIDLGSGKHKRLLITRQEGRYMAKARVLPEELGRIDNPTFDKVLQLVRQQGAG